jgi:ketosteroid isomerase-like protein
MKAIAVVLLAAIMLSCRSSASDDPEQVRSELAALEKRLIAAVQAKDMKTLDEIWDDQYFGTAPNGATVRKADLMAAVEHGVIQIDYIEPTDLYVRMFGDVAVMTGKASVKAKVVDESYEADVRGTGIFVRRNGQWKIAGVHVGPYRPGQPLNPGAAN